MHNSLEKGKKEITKKRSIVDWNKKEKRQKEKKILKKQKRTIIWDNEIRKALKEQKKNKKNPPKNKSKV